MLGRWIAAHKSLVVTAVSGAAIVAVVATFAVASTGYTAQKLDLGDGSVWVPNSQNQVIGRANPAVLELNTVVRSKGAQLGVVQSGDTVLLVDRADATVSIVDPATSVAGQPIALPPEQPQVAIAGGRVVIYEGGTGRLWFVDADQLASFDATAPASLSLGARSVISVAPDGTLIAYSPETQRVYRVDAATSDVVASRWQTAFGAGSTYQTTSAGGRWAVLDAGSRRLQLDGRAVDLSKLIPAGSDPVLQQAGPASDRILVASTRGLVAVPLDGGAPAAILADRSGTPAPPLVLDGCVYAAWSSGQAWMRCGSEPPDRMTLPSMPGNASLAFLVNTRQVVLNDARGGASWAVQHGGRLIDNWDALIKKDDQQQQQENNQDVPPDVDPEQKPPVAVDDDFGARPGRSSVLPVLLNDYDPNGDVLVIDSFDQLDPAQGRVDLINRNQQLQITLPATASAPISFTYTISDGRGGTATATVHVTVRTPQENSPPVQVRTTKTTVEEGGRISTQVIGDWVDPDGDPFYLTAASSTSGDLVTHTPDGVVTFADDGQGGSAKTVTLTMSDGRAEGSGSLSVAVKPTGEVPITVEDWAAPATAGLPITLKPLTHVRGGSGTIRLNAVPAKAGATITPNFADGTFTFVSDQVGTHYVDFTVTDGTHTATGLVRIIVASPDAGSRPITVPKTIFVTALSSQTIDPTQTDIDPAGGVLVVTDLENIPAGGGVEGEVLDQHDVRVTLTRPLDGQIVSFNYRISNGLADALGTISVVEIPEPAQLQPPVAVDDQVTVRVGDTVDIPVLDNDSQPDGKPITLVPKLAQGLPVGGGLLFASGDVLRYLAPSTAGNYSAVYSIAGPDGQTAEATVSISVREIDVSTNNPPVPARVTARALAGGDAIKIPIPLAGIDPDGDSVSLIGIASNPQKGSVLSVGASDIEYKAGDYSTGTDTFQYTVVDALGARATGTVRVGISPRPDGARNPVANPDRVQARPGRTVSIQVLANDSDPDGSPLSVVSVTPNTPGTKAKVIDGTIVQITPPKTPGTYAAIYTIQNGYGGTSSNFVTVEVDPNAPLAYPVVQDTVLSVSDVVDRTSVDVPVLDNVFFADGPVTSLGLSLLPGYSSGALVLPNDRIRVKIGAKSQVIPFAVAHPDDPTIRSFGFIRVPGTDDALPQLNTKAPPLVVKSEQSLDIDLDDYVVTLAGQGVKITDDATVKATHANGDDLVVNSHTLRFTSAARYFGPASITFEVTDGSSANQGQGRTAILTLPIKVNPRDNQPPSFVGNVVDFEPGQSKELDLVKLTNYPYPDVAELVYTVLDPKPQGFDVQLTGQRITITAADSAKSGDTASLSIGVRDAVNTGQSGLISLQVVPSTRPLAQPVPDRAVAPRGGTTSVDVLANDAANNPFPNTPLRVIDIRGLDGASLPPGLSITPSADKSRLSVSVAQSAQPADTTLQYEVADATGDPARYVWGNVTVSVQDVPDPVTDVHVTEFGDRLLKVGWSPGQFNNSPISGYQVTMTDASGNVVSTTPCTATVGCALTTPGNGPNNAVTLSVVAINGIGTSSPTIMPGTIWSDIIPPPPTGLSSAPLDGGLRVSWSKPVTSGGSPITQYVINVGGVIATLAVDPGDPAGTTYSRNVSGGSITNGAVTSYSVSARNSAPNSLATWNQAQGTGIPAGPPIAVGAASASASTNDGTTANVSWAGAFSDNGAAVSRYYSLATTGPAPSCVVSGVDTGNGQITTEPAGAKLYPATASTAAFTGLTPNTTYTIYVWAFNGQGCTVVASNQVTPRAIPGTVTSATAAAPAANGVGRWDSALASPTPSGNTSYQYRIVIGGAAGDVGEISSGSSAFLTDASAYGTPGAGFQLKQCDSWPEGKLCSTAWSATFPMQEAIDNSPLGSLTATTSALGGVSWSWGSIPTGSYSAIDYTCDNGNSWTALSANGRCQSNTPLTAPPLQVRITANNGQTYIRTYAANQYGG
ncbi:Ig-like domain-containing protein [Pseudolysinimonas sp.]|uniref:Ig-like domain-containing protein n=1 Tax=Pseudolysinimonas sp. TaxID=2680009 RepID=UPI003F80ACBD